MTPRPDYLRWAVLRLTPTSFTHAYLKDGETCPENAISLHRTGTDALTVAKLETSKARINAERASRKPEPAPVQEELVP